MRDWLKILVTLVVVTLIVSACAPAATPTPTEVPPTEPPATYLDTIMAKGKIVVGTSADYPPFEYVDEEGNFAGFDMDVIREIGKRLGVEVEIVDMAFDTIIAAVQQGKIDCAIAAMSATAERDEKVDFTIAYYKSADSMLVASDSTIEISKPEDAAAHNIGVQTGTTHEDWVLEVLVETGLMPEDRVFRYERADQAALDLEAGRIDVLFVDEAVGKAFEEEMNLKVIFVGYLAQEPDAIAILEGATELKAALDEVVTQMEEEGVLDELKALHFE